MPLLMSFRVRLHVTEMKSHCGMKKFLFTREFHPWMKRVEFYPGMKRVEFHPEMKLNLSTCTKQLIKNTAPAPEAWGLQLY